MRTPLLAVFVALAASCSHSTTPSTTTATPVSSAPSATQTAAPAISPIPPNAAAQKEWEPALLALIGRATTMQAARVKTDQATMKFAIGPDTNADALARRAASAILTKTTDRKKRCGFDPGVALRLCDDKKDCAIVLVCFSCSDLAVQKPDGSITRLLDFDESKAEFIAIAKAALPNDAEIQKL